MFGCYQDDWRLALPNLNTDETGMICYHEDYWGVSVVQSLAQSVEHLLHTAVPQNHKPHCWKEISARPGLLLKGRSIGYCSPQMIGLKNCNPDSGGKRSILDLTQTLGWD